MLDNNLAWTEESVGAASAGLCMFLPMALSATFWSQMKTTGIPIQAPGVCPGGRQEMHHFHGSSRKQCWNGGCTGAILYSAAGSPFPILPPLFFFTHCACLVAQAPSKNPFSFLFLFFSQPCWDALAQMRKKGGKEYVMGERREKKKGWSRKVPHDILELEPSSAPLPAVAMRKFPHKSSPQPLPSSPFTSDKVGSFFTRMEILWIEDGAQNEDRCLEVPVPSASFLK